MEFLVPYIGLSQCEVGDNPLRGQPWPTSDPESVYNRHYGPRFTFFTSLLVMTMAWNSLGDKLATFSCPRLIWVNHLKHQVGLPLLASSGEHLEIFLVRRLSPVSPQTGVYTRLASILNRLLVDLPGQFFFTHTQIALFWMVCNWGRFFN